VWPGKANGSEPSVKCRNRLDGIETGERRDLGMSLGETLLTAQVVPGMKAARAQVRLWHGTWEPVAPMRWSLWLPEGGPRAADTARGRVPMRGTGADRLVVAMRPGNAGGAKGAGHLGLVDGQPPAGGRSR
jgi:hypothetical protein